MQYKPASPSLPKHDAVLASAPAVVQSQSLFPPGQREVTIEHGNTQYRLRITAQGKLILTK
ncbi:MAG TPA: hemin uptake protein HemP [Limnobacter sp.]|nr:hemin uptake protein HemP [Limnobacter sp.]